MASIQRVWYSKTSIEKSRDGESNRLRNTLKILTTDRVTWDWLERQNWMPKANAEHFSEPGFYLDSWKPNQIQKCYWEVELEYVPFTLGKIDANPLNRRAEITFDATLVEQATLRDANGNPICTTAGEFFTGIMQQIPIVEYTIQKNLPSDPAFLLTHIGAVNLDTLKLRGVTWKPKTLLLASLSGGAFTIENRVEFAPYTMKLMGDPRSWTQEVWNRGTVQLRKVWRTFDDPKSKSGLTYKQIWIQEAIEAGDPPEPVSDPVPLDINGRAIPEYLQKDSTQPIRPDALIKLYFETQKALPFQGVLPLA